MNPSGKIGRQHSMPEISVNGEKMKIKEGQTIDALIQQLGLDSKWVVAELNHKALTKKEYAQIILSDGDSLELVRAVSGG